MSKITTKRQVTIPKRIADEYGIEPGDEIGWEAEGEAIRVVLRPEPREVASVEELLKLFDQATERQLQRQQGAAPARPRQDRGWTREELYDRGVPR